MKWKAAWRYLRESQVKDAEEQEEREQGPRSNSLTGDDHTPGTDGFVTCFN